MNIQLLFGNSSSLHASLCPRSQFVYDIGISHPEVVPSYAEHDSPFLLSPSQLQLQPMFHIISLEPPNIHAFDTNDVPPSYQRRTFLDQAIQSNRSLS
jgi:hypothetical protein